MLSATADRSTRIQSLLLIDRDAATGNGLDACWAPQARPAVIHASSGRQAMEFLRGMTFEIVLADLTSILDLAAETDEAIARLVKASADSLIIGLSDATSVSAAVAAMRAGAHDYLAKPLDGETLVACIDALGLRHGRTQLPPAPIDTDMIGVADTESLRGRDTLKLGGVLPMWQQEQRIIEDAIRTCAGNIAAAAAALELSPSTIYRKRQAWADMDGKRGAA